MKRKIMALSFIALFASVLLLQGCSADKVMAVAGKTFTYTAEPESGIDSDRFSIKLNTDGTFIYHECIYSSHLGVGNWSIDGDVLTLTEDNEYHPRKNTFRIDGGDIIFIENGSANFLYIKVEDGERFSSDGSIAVNTIVR